MADRYVIDYHNNKDYIIQVIAGAGGKNKHRIIWK